MTEIWPKNDKKLKGFWQVFDKKMIGNFWGKKANIFFKKIDQINMRKSWPKNETKMRENWRISDHFLNEIIWPKSDHFLVSFFLDLEKKSNFKFFFSNFSKSGSIRIRLISDRILTKIWSETGQNWGKKLGFKYHFLPNIFIIYL